MGIDADCARFLIQARKEGASFARTLTLGRLEWFVKPEELQLLARHFNGAGPDPQAFRTKYSEPFYKLLGAETADSMDVSDYEQATVLHDLNQPVPQELKGRYTVVFDGGTLEHVFNTAEALRNCMQMLAIGGHFLAFTPVNNSMGHGFYQFSPELFFSVFTAENGFRIQRMLLTTNDADGVFGDWYEVADPHVVRDRVQLTNDRPAFLLVIAEKIAEVTPFRKPPQQSDYESSWSIVKATQEQVVREGESKLMLLYRTYMPMPVKTLIRRVYNLLTRRTQETADLGRIDARYFKRFAKP